MEAHGARGFTPLVALLLIASVAAHGEDEEYLNALVPLMSRRAAFKDAGSCPASGPVCHNCSTAPICIYFHEEEEAKFLGSYSCPEQNPDKPHCNNGVCSSSVSQDCLHDFQCTSEGYFPDPDDCRTFHLCNLCNKTLNVTTFTCPPNFVYVHASNSCARQKVPTDCVVIKCRYAVPLEYVPYPRNPSLFAICIRDRPTLIVKCGNGQEFDSRESRCKFVCKKEGVFAADGCRKFYECVRVNANTFNTVEGECPASTKFDPVSSGCTLGTCGGNSSTGTNTVAVLRRTIDDEQSWGSSS